MPQELEVNFVKSFDKKLNGKVILDKEGNPITSALYFITGGNPELIAKYAEIQKRELNTASGLYPYYATKFFGNESTIEYVHNEKHHDFFPNRSYEKAVAVIKQKAFIRGLKADNPIVIAELDCLEEKSGKRYAYPKAPVVDAPAVDAPVVAEDATGDEF